MKNKLFENVDNQISSYNSFKIITKSQSVVRKIPTKDIIFNKMTNLTEVSLLEDGYYKIEHIDNYNKNLKINIAPGVKAIIFEKSDSNEDVNLNNIDFIVSENAKVQYNVLDKFNKSYASRSFDVKKNAAININIVSLCSVLSENKLVVDLNEQSAKANVKIVTTTKDHAQAYFDVCVNNNAKNTTGEIWQKGVCQRDGQIFFDATSQISKGCDNAKNFQESRVLLLDGASVSDASPNLLIDHFNVEAGHAASVSRANDDELYYLQSRGLSKFEAEQLITLAFIKPLFDVISSDDIKDELLNAILERLGINETI